MEGANLIVFRKGKRSKNLGKGQHQLREAVDVAQCPQLFCDAQRHLPRGINTIVVGTSAVHHGLCLLFFFVFRTNKTNQNKCWSGYDEAGDGDKKTCREVV